MRAEGFATARGEREPDLSAVAAPVFDGSGELAAILGVQGPSSRFDASAMAAAIPAVCEHARAISAALGHRAAPEEQAVTGRRDAGLHKEAR